MGLKQWMLPRGRPFYDRIDAAAKNAHAAAESFAKLVDDYSGLAHHRATIKELHQKSALITLEILDNVGRSVATPWNIEHVRALGQAFESIVGAIYGASNRLFLFKIPKANGEMHRFAAILTGQTEQLRKAAAEIRRSRDVESCQPFFAEVARLEDEADRVLMESVAGLFEGTDAISIMKQKEIYETLETATDCCKRAADILRDIARNQR